MPVYSVLTSDGYRADCKGETIIHAIKNLVNDYPHVVKDLTPNYITYINGVSSYGFHSTKQTVNLVEKLKKESKKFDAVWERVYNMDGFGLSDYLNDFSNSNEFKSSQHGEKVYYESDSSNWQWDNFSDFRSQVDYYYNGLIGEIKKNKIKLSEDEICAILVYIAGLNSKLFSFTDNDFLNFERPAGHEKFMFC